MRNKKLIIGIIIVIALAGFVLVVKSVLSAGKGKKPAPSAQVRNGSKKVPVKKEKIISKGRGGLTTRILNSKNTEIPMRVKVFRVIDSRSSIYAASTVGGRMQELLPGVYDIEIDTVPQKIFKNVKIEEGKETTEDLGCVTGSLIVRVINAKKSPAYYPLRIMYGKIDEMVTAFMTNKTLELVPGVYDIEIGTSPRQYKKDVKIEAGKETIADLGCLTGILIVKTVNADKKDVRCNVRVTKADTNEIVSAAASNKPVELIKGKYNIDVMSSPRQSKKDVTVNTGEESVIEFTVVAPQAVSQKAAAPAKMPASRPQSVKSKQ